MFKACEGLLVLTPDFGRQPVQIPLSGPAKTVPLKDMSSPSDPGPTALQPAYLCKTHIRNDENPCPATEVSQTTYSVPAEYAGTALSAELKSPSDCYHSEQYLLGWLIRLYGWRVMEPGVLRKCSRSAESKTGPREALDRDQLEAAA